MTFKLPLNCEWHSRKAISNLQKSENGALQKAMSRSAREGWPTHHFTLN
jgi:hypothetical protein